MTDFPRMTLAAAVGVSMLALGGCGGEDAGGNSFTESQAFETYFTEAGLWRAEADIFLDLQTAQQGISIDGSIDASTVSFTTVDVVGSDSIVDGCAPGGAITLTSDQVFEDTDFLDSGTLSLFCGSTSEVFTPLGDDALRVDLTCDGQTLLAATFTRISSTPVFDNGSLSMTSSALSHPALDASSGVCAQTGDLAIDLTATSSSGTEVVNQQVAFLIIGAPYNGARLTLDMAFGAQAVTTGVGTYTVVDDVDTLANGVEVTVYSTIFGGTASSPDFVFADSGTVTISAINAGSMSGSYNLLTSSGDTLNGSFVLNF